MVCLLYFFLNNLVVGIQILTGIPINTTYLDWSFTKVDFQNSVFLSWIILISILGDLINEIPLYCLLQLSLVRIVPTPHLIYLKLKVRIVHNTKIF